jgi:cell division protein FtsI/penicillin-binding protein 2
LSALLAWSVIYAINLARGRPEVKAPANLQVLPLTPPPPAGIALDKAALAELLGARELPADPGGLLELKGPDGQTLYARTTLDPVLQAKALELVAQAGAVRAALVVVDPATGRVLALAGAGRDGGNAALSGTYPAASVFKMVTAAAAVERASLTSDSVINYDGAKHTLYKANVVKGLDQGTHRTTLRTGFAQSVNSVFGKIGALAVGGQGLARTADNFGFNRALPFEMPLEASTFALGTTGSLAPPATPPAGDYEETPESALPEATLEEAGVAPAGESDLDSEIFHLAELASGFNRATRISPVHGALMAAAAVNGGTLYEPTVIDEVFTRANEILYQGVSIPAGPAVMAETAAELRDMMHATVLEGTGRKRLSDALEQPVLSRLELGGKSGSINDDDGSRVDWFVAFANPREPDSTAPPLALAAVVVHQGGFRLASQDLVRRALLVYYGDRL